MSKLLVNAPSGAQEIIEVGEGGGYFDQARVLWDEREDGPLPEITLGGMIRQDGALEFDQARMGEHEAALNPPPAVPAAVTMRQARLALLGAGLLDDVDAAIAALPSPQKEAAKIEWEYSQEVQRHNGFVSVLAPILGMTAEQTDAMFIGAANL